MDTVDIAVTRLKIGRVVKKPGDPVPESVDFPNRENLLKSGRLRPVPVDDLTKNQRVMLRELTDARIKETHDHAHSHAHVKAHAQAHLSARGQAHMHVHAHQQAHAGVRVQAYVEKSSASGLKHLGGGWYELPSGTKIRGRQAALDALEGETGEVDGREGDKNQG